MTRVFRHEVKYCARERVFTQCLHSKWPEVGTDLELSEDTLRLDLPGVSAAHQVVLQHGAGGEGEVTHLALHQVSPPVTCTLHLAGPAPLLGRLGVAGGRGAGVRGHAE